jgi:hypothetical protein
MAPKPDKSNKLSQAGLGMTGVHNLSQQTDDAMMMDYVFHDEKEKVLLAVVPVMVDFWIQF